ncbi:MAG: hypothetical protein HRU07_03500 [Nitrosopumilus sp.]|nr:hypothetical protein [Nitrosopumilus sp.]
MVSNIKNQKWKYLGLLAILPLALVSLAPDLVDDAYAQKSEGSPGNQSPKSYGSATDDIVCGAKLCSTPQGSPDPVNEGKAQ